MIQCFENRHQTFEKVKIVHEVKVRSISHKCVNYFPLAVPPTYSEKSPWKIQVETPRRYGRQIQIETKE